MLKSILFDFDGTLLNSESIHFDSWNQTLLPFEVSLKWDDYLLHYAGTPTNQNAKILIERFDLPISSEALTKSREQIGNQERKKPHANINALCG